MPEGNVALRRILLPVDMSRDSLRALEVAFQLAGSLGGEVSGLFIEDNELCAAGSLSFVREVGSLSGISRRISPSDIERQFRTIASKARKMIADAALRLKVGSSFRIARGDVSAEILAAAIDADIVVLGKAGWTIGSVRKPGKTCLAVISKSRVPVLIVERDALLSPPVVAVSDGTEAGQRAVSFAEELARKLDWEMVLFTVHDVRSGDEALGRIGNGKTRLVVLPASLPLTRCGSQLKNPMLFVP
jgi:nucleotide-binding universal stress UspA family protein